MKTPSPLSASHFLRKTTASLAWIALTASLPMARGQEDMSKPVITTEIKKGPDGKDQTYMCASAMFGSASSRIEK